MRQHRMPFAILFSVILATSCLTAPLSVAREAGKSQSMGESQGDGKPLAAGQQTLPINLLDPPQGLFLEDWMIVELSDQKVGYAHSTFTREGDTIQTRTITAITIRRAKIKIDINVMQTAQETVGGVPLKFESISKLSTIDQAMRGVIEDGKVRITSAQFGMETEQTYDYPAGAKMLWGTFRAGIEHGFSEGTTYDLDIYEPSLRTDAAINAKITVGKKMTITLPDGPREAIKVITSMNLPMGSFENIGYVDAMGRVLRTEIPMAGLSMRLTATTREQALDDFDPPEFFVDTLVQIDRAIDRDTAQRIEYTLKISGADRSIPDLPTNAMQTPGVRTKQSATIVVQRIDQDQLRKLPMETTHSEAMKPYLKAGPSINIHDAEIIKMAKEARGDTTHPYLVADKLRVYVSKIITEKNLNIGFATASEVCRKREGDCSEHAVLLAALGRVVNLPSRVVVGLAYVPEFAGKRNVFGFHMWTQFNLGGKWIDFDAALRESDCSPARIALATSSLNDAGIGDIAFAIIDIITGLEIKIDKIESR